MRQYWRATALVALAVSVPQSQAAPPPQAATLACRTLVPPSDSGSGTIGAVAPGPSDRLAWTDGRPGQFLLRDGGGRVRVVGRRGAGPGEFQDIGGMSWIGDTLWVADVRLPRVQFFSDTGRLLRVRTALLPGSWGPRPDGALIGLGHRLIARDLPVTLLVHRPEAIRHDTLASFPLLEVERVMVPAGGREVPNPHPLLAQTQAAANAERTRFCAVIPAGAAVRLRCVDAYGQSLLDRPVTLPARPVTDAIYNAVIGVFSNAPGRTPELMRARISRPRSLPLALGILVGTDGEIWLARTYRFESVASWTRLRPDGTVQDQVTIPANYRLLQLRGDSVWATSADADDLQTLLSCAVKG